MTIDFMSGASEVARATGSIGAAFAPPATGACSFGDLLETAGHVVPPMPLPVFTDAATQPSMDGRNQAITATTNGPLAPAPPVPVPSAGDVPVQTIPLPAGEGQPSPGWTGTHRPAPAAPESTAAVSSDTPVEFARTILAQQRYQANSITAVVLDEFRMDTLSLER